MDGVYWISGKPGSGKSTLVDHLVNNPRTKSELGQRNNMAWTILHFYFDFRGGQGISNSFEGLLRSLLYQLVEAMPQLEVKGVDDGRRDHFSDWSERRLREILRTSLENAKGGVCIFVDGLDEYAGDDVLDLIQFLKSLAPSKGSQRTSIKVCVSSRPETIPSQLLLHLPNLSTSEYNESGIRSYCLRTLEAVEPEVRKDLDISRLTGIIARLAEGVFLWARFAQKEVFRGHCSGENFAELLERLQAIPRDLEDVYDRMLSRLEPTAKQECMIMLQLVCFARRSLTWQELLVATNFAMNKDVVISERICSDEDSGNAPKVYDTFARRLRAKAVGLLELVKTDDFDDEVPKLIHRSVSTYLNQKGWQTLGALKGEISIRAESLYVETCTRYLHCLLRHCRLETNTSQSIWDEWFDGKVFFMPKKPRINGSTGIYPFFAYAARYVFVHANFVEQYGYGYGASSYTLLHDALTEQFFNLIFRGEFYLGVRGCKWEFLYEDFDAIFVAFFFGLVQYCIDDLATRSPAPGQVFWERALRCALFQGDRSFAGNFAGNFAGSTETVILALRNIITVKQIHLEETWTPDCLKLVLQHDSIKSLRLFDRKGQAVTLLWLFTQRNLLYPFREFLNLLVKKAIDRGEDLRQRCGPEGNLVETLMEERPNHIRREKLRALREYYESMSWPFEYDTGEIEMIER